MFTFNTPQYDILYIYTMPRTQLTCFMWGGFDLNLFYGG